MKKGTKKTAKWLSLFAFIAGMLICLCLFVACDDVDDTDTACSHNFIHYDANPATCLSDGWEAYDKCMLCGKTTFVEAKATGHDYSNGSVTCNRCGVFHLPTVYITDFENPSIPLVDLKKSNGEINVKFVYDSNDGENVFFECVAKIKVQGASSAAYDKKNYTIKLYKDDTFEDKNKVDLGWGKENKYCMKANWIDCSHARNIIGARMFSQIVDSRSEINTNLQNAPNNGLIDGYPVVVYVNGEFHGLYTMNIPKDSWQFAMEGDETTKEALLMSDGWTDSTRLRTEIGEGAFEDYKWELEYCSTEDTDTTWVKDSFNELIRLLNCGDEERIRNELPEHLDIEAAIDNMLFTYFLNAADNTGKNILWATYDGKVWIPSMYDMDSTFGIYYNGSETGSRNIYPSLREDGSYSLGTYYNQMYVVLLDCYADEVEARWTYLRQEILTVENTRTHFESFMSTIPESVYDAELKKWTGIPGQATNKTNMYFATEEQLARLDAFFYNFNK